MRSSAVLLLVAVSLSLALVTLCDEVSKDVQQRREKEEQCRSNSGVSKEEIKNFRCKIPTDPDVRDRVGKYSLCSSLNLHQVLANGSLAVPRGCQAHAEAEAEAETGAEAATTRRPPPPRCQALRRAAACAAEKELGVGSSPEQRALAARVCLCQVKQRAVAVARCEEPEVREEPRCVELLRRRNGEQRCRKDSGLTPRQIREGNCKLPDDADVKEKLAKYDLCFLLNNGQILSNGTGKEMFAAVNCSDASSGATTEAPARNKKKQERIAFICDLKRKFATCRKEKQAEFGGGQEHLALAHQLCKCEAAAAAARHRRQEREKSSR